MQSSLIGWQKPAATVKVWTFPFWIWLLHWIYLDSGLSLQNLIGNLSISFRARQHLFWRSLMVLNVPWYEFIVSISTCIWSWSCERMGLNSNEIEKFCNGIVYFLTSSSFLWGRSRTFRKIPRWRFWFLLTWFHINFVKHFLEFIKGQFSISIRVKLEQLQLQPDFIWQ